MIRFCMRSILASVLLIAPALTFAQNPLDEYPQFSAKANGGPLNWKALQIYRSGSQMRGEYTRENEIRIANVKNRNGWVMRPLNWVGKPKECTRMSLLDISSYPFFAYTSDKFTVERTAAEAKVETIENHSCKVEEYSVKPKDGGSEILMTLWRAEDLQGFPVKVAVKPMSRAAFTITYSDVHVGAPEAKLFQLPPLCGVRSGATKKSGATAPKSSTVKNPVPQKP